ncbi:MAG: aspartate aminotransferase [Rhodobacteraceae bacterium]|nr:MAG: aspartate aminotransferase [Paracoccaceae bacterium]
MQFPERFSDLPEYAFPRLRALLDPYPAGGDVLHMSLGEPKHAFPDFVTQVIAQHSAGFGSYPPNNGCPELLNSISNWFMRRYAVTLNPDTQILPLNGTREGLFNACLAVCPETKNGRKPNILMPNPFYQVYAVATLTAGATPVFVSATLENGFLPDYTLLDEAILQDTAIIYICSPSNPQGAIASKAYWTDLINLAEKHDIRIFADECYSEIYRTTPPAGALEIATQLGADPERVVVFHSLSKRSNLPGLRSGFAAGGPKTINEMKKLRAYSGAPLPLPLQMAAARVWDDEEHVIANRAAYARKYKLADDILGSVPNYQSPEAGFFLWLRVEDGEAATLKLWQTTGVRVLPGSYLARPTKKDDPAKGYIRVALVAPEQEIARGLNDIRATLY